MITKNTSLVTPRWPGYAASACALAFAMVTFYWVLGGRGLLDLIGTGLVRLADAHDPEFSIAMWASALLKVAGAVFALALVQPWGPRLVPRRLLLAVGWSCSALLIVYGGWGVVYMLLVVMGKLPVPPGNDWRTVQGHLFVWSPWFGIWGVLLALATLSLARASRPPAR